MTYYSQIEHYRGFSDKLDAHIEAKTENITGLVWANRLGVNTVTALTRDTDTFINLSEGLGVHTPTGDLYGVDLESLDDPEKVRVYVDPRRHWSEETKLLGYYIDRSGYISVVKRYRKAADDTGLLVNRFDGEDQLISADEPEEMCTVNEWKGPAELAQITLDNNLHHTFFKKVSKDQSYLNVRFDVPQQTGFPTDVTWPTKPE